MIIFFCSEQLKMEREISHFRPTKKYLMSIVPAIYTNDALRFLNFMQKRIEIIWGTRILKCFIRMFMPRKFDFFGIKEIILPMTSAFFIYCRSECDSYESSVTINNQYRYLLFLPNCHVENFGRMVRKRYEISRW